MFCARKWSLALTLAVLSAGLTGCTAMMPANRLEGLNARRIPKNLLEPPRSNKEPLDFVMLRQDPPKPYKLDAFDTLGIYIEGILGKEDEPPPYEPDPLGNTPPAVGYPIPIREDGTLVLPLLKEPIQLKGKSVAEAQDAIREAYIAQNLFSLRAFESWWRCIDHGLIRLSSSARMVVGNSENQVRIDSKRRTTQEASSGEQDIFWICLPMRTTFSTLSWKRAVSPVSTPSPRSKFYVVISRVRFKVPKIAQRC